MQLNFIKKDEIVTAVLVFVVLLVGTLGFVHFRSALVGSTVEIPVECADLVSKGSKDDSSTLKTAIFLLRDVNIAGLDSKFSNAEAAVFCKKFKHFQEVFAQKTPMNLQVVNVIDYREPITKITVGIGKSVINGQEAQTQDSKIGPQDIDLNNKKSPLYFAPGKLDFFVAVSDTEEYANILYKENPSLKINLAASTYPPSKLSNGAGAIFVNAKENWIQQNYDYETMLMHELVHTFEFALDYSKTKTPAIHQYGRDWVKDEIAVNNPSSNWIYSQNAVDVNGVKNPSYVMEAKFINFLFDDVFTPADLWGKVSTRQFAKDFAKDSVRFGSSKGTKAVNRFAPNIVEIPVFRKEGDFFTVVFTTQSLHEKKFRYLLKDSVNVVWGEELFGKLLNNQWITKEADIAHDKKNELHQAYKELPHYDEPHQHFEVKIPVSEAGNGRYIKIWAADGGKWVNPEISGVVKN